MHLKYIKKAEYFALICAMLIWATSYIWSSEALEYYKPITIVLFRLIISTIVIFGYLKLTGKLKPIKKQDLFLVFILSFCEPFIYYIGETYGIQLLSPTVASVIIGTMPLFTPFAAAVFLKDKLSAFNVFGVLISFSGVFILTYNPTADWSVTSKGLVFLFISVFSGVAYSILMKNMVQKHSVLNLIMYQNIIGIFLFLPIFFVSDFKHFISVGLVWTSFYPIIKLAIFATTIAYLFYTFAIKRMLISKANVFTNTIPVFTIIMSYFFLNEQITEQKVMGIIIVIVGVFISQMSKKSLYGFITKNVVKRIKQRI